LNFPDLTGAYGSHPHFIILENSPASLPPNIAFDGCTLSTCDKSDDIALQTGWFIIYVNVDSTNKSVTVMAPIFPNYKKPLATSNKMKKLGTTM